MTNANGALLPTTLIESIFEDGGGYPPTSTLINQALPYQMTTVFNFDPNDDSPFENVTFTYTDWGPVTKPLLLKKITTDDTIETNTTPIPFPC